MNCIPCISYCDPQANSHLPVPNQPNSSLKERVCPYCKLLPAILVLVANIIGIALVLICHNHSLVTPFAAGAAFSLYLIYLSYQARLLQSLETTDRQLRETSAKNQAQLEILTKQNEEFKVNITALDQSAKTSAQHAAGLEVRLKEADAHVGKLEEHTKTLAAQTTQQAQTISQIQTERDELAKQNAALKGNLAELRTALTSMHAQETERAQKFQTIVESAEKASKEGGLELRKILSAYNHTLEGFRKDHADSNQNLTEEVRSLQVLHMSMSGLYEVLERTIGDTAFQKNMAAFSTTVERQMEIEKQISARTAELKVIEARLNAASQELEVQARRMSESNKTYQATTAAHADLVAQTRVVMHAATSPFIAMATAMGSLSPVKSPLTQSPPLLNTPPPAFQPPPAQAIIASSPLQVGATTTTTTTPTGQTVAQK